jgi:uncharacterized protein
MLQQAIPMLTWVLIFSYLAGRYKINLAPILGLSLPLPPAYYFRQSLLAIISVVAMVMVMSLLVSTTTESPQHLPDPYKDLSGEQLKMMALLGIVTAPIIEEIVFRGFLQSTFYRYFSSAGAVLMSAMVFGVLHTLYQDVPLAQISVYLLGVVFGYFRLKTGSILPGMVAHLFNNVVAALYLLI